MSHDIKPMLRVYRPEPAETGLTVRDLRTVAFLLLQATGRPGVAVKLIVETDTGEAVTVELGTERRTGPNSTVVDLRSGCQFDTGRRQN